MKIDNSRKPKKNAMELVLKLKDEKGVTFDKISINEAAKYFTNKNNYLRTAAYRKNYSKHRDGENEGKYIHLDFTYLMELSTIDMYLRQILLKMCIDIEHALKVALLTDIENNDAENGYDIVNEFLDKNPNIEINIAYKSKAIFTDDLIANYFETATVYDPAIDREKTIIIKRSCPIWVLLEIISFGDTLKLYDFYRDKYPESDIIELERSILNPVKSLRNACAHNNCLLNSLNHKSARAPAKITQYITSFKNVKKEERRNKLACRPMFEIVCMLYVYNKVVSKQVREHGMNDLRFFVNARMLKNINYFYENQVIYTTFVFFSKLIDNIIYK